MNPHNAHPMRADAKQKHFSTRCSTLCGQQAEVGQPCRIRRYEALQSRAGMGNPVIRGEDSTLRGGQGYEFFAPSLLLGNRMPDEPLPFLHVGRSLLDSSGVRKPR
jgi:hypothetical protein